MQTTGCAYYPRYVNPTVPGHVLTPTNQSWSTDFNIMIVQILVIIILVVLTKIDWLGWDLGIVISVYISSGPTAEHNRLRVPISINPSSGHWK